MEFIKNYVLVEQVAPDIEKIRIINNFKEVFIHKPTVILDYVWYDSTEELNEVNVYKFTDSPYIFFEDEYKRIIKDTEVITFFFPEDEVVDFNKEGPKQFKVVQSNDKYAFKMRFDNEIVVMYLEAMEQGKCYFDIENKQLLIKEEE